MTDNTNTQHTPADDTVANVLGAGKATSRDGVFKRYKKWFITGAAVLLLLIAFLFMGAGKSSRAITYEEKDVTKGELVVRVSATGNLQPTNEVDVGSELSGTVEVVLVDDNDVIKKGQVLAKLDTDKLEDQVNKSAAAVDAAKANVNQAIATRNESKVNLQRLKKVWELSGGKVPSKTEMATAEANYARAVADVASARANVAEANAQLRSDKTNLAKATIRSPIDGVVLSRDVEPGQTVAASFTAPVLFTLAESLSSMELEVAVDEADVGQVKEGQSAVFSVDAYADREYPAKVLRVGLGSQTTDNVVSYLTILKIDNSDLTLRPGMTATADIVTNELESALLVPNAALRYTPEDINEGGGEKSGMLSKILPKRPGSKDKKKATNVQTTSKKQTVWVLEGNHPKAIPVTVGATNGTLTEIVDGEITESMRVIVDSMGEVK